MSPYDHPEYHALIRRIREIDRAPVDNDSTLARLVTADWLEERGEAERAEFIRTWIEHERLSRSLAEPTKSSTCRRLIRVVNRLMHTRRNGTPQLAEVDASGLPLIDEIRCPLAWWLEHGPDIVRRHPVREVVITDEPATLTEWWSTTGQESVDVARLKLWQKLAVIQMPLYFAASPESAEYPDSDRQWRPYLNAAALLWAESEADRQPEGVELVPIQLTDADHILLAGRQHTA